MINNFTELQDYIINIFETNLPKIPLYRTFVEFEENTEKKGNVPYVLIDFSHIRTLNNNLGGVRHGLTLMTVKFTVASSNIKNIDKVNHKIRETFTGLELPNCTEMVEETVTPYVDFSIMFPRVYNTLGYTFIYGNVI